MGKAKHNL